MRTFTEFYDEYPLREVARFFAQNDLDIDFFCAHLLDEAKRNPEILSEGLGNTWAGLKNVGRVGLDAYRQGRDLHQWTSQMQANLQAINTLTQSLNSLGVTHPRQIKRMNELATWIKWRMEQGPSYQPRSQQQAAPQATPTQAPQATPTQATPTQATPTQATPTQATPTQATPTQAAPSSGGSSWDNPGPDRPSSWDRWDRPNKSSWPLLFEPSGAQGRPHAHLARRFQQALYQRQPRRG